METINIDNILQELEGTEPQTLISSSDHNTVTGLSETDIMDILEENGYTPPLQEDTSAVEENRTEEPVVVEDPVPETPQEETTAEPSEEPAQEEAEEEIVPLLPQNSPTLLISDATSRFSGAEWYNEIRKARVIIAGIGGIGSNLAFQIARMAPENITLYDADTVEVANMAGQLFSMVDVGRTKVAAITAMISKYCDLRQVNAIAEPFTPDTEPGNIMMCGFDNMTARREFFNIWREHVKNKPEEERAKCLYLDGRLSMDMLQIFCIQGNDSYNMSRYKREFLFFDSEAEQTVCSMKQTTYLACMIGSLMTNLFTNFIANTLNPVVPYDLPFFTEYDAQNMIFRTEN